MSFVICIAQLNFVVGDVPGNAQKIINAARQAHAAGARLLLTPELALCGYAAEDLYLRPSFLSTCEVCDGRRYFVPGEGSCVFEVEGVRLGLLSCEDAWYPGPARGARQAGAQLLLTLNASPYHLGKGAEREQVMRERVLETGLPLVYAHLVGGQDEVVFEGRSFALNADGSVAARAPSFEKKMLFAQVHQAQEAITIEADVAPTEGWEAELWSALVLGVRDYVGKNGFPGALLGLSGGIDSALVLAIAVDALGAERVRAVMMPSPYTADISWIDARDMAERLKVRYDEIAIAPQFEAFKAALAPQFARRPEDTTEENLQARIRGT